MVPPGPEMPLPEQNRHGSKKDRILPKKDRPLPEKDRFLPKKHAIDLSNDDINPQVQLSIINRQSDGYQADVDSIQTATVCHTPSGRGQCSRMITMITGKGQCMCMTWDIIMLDFFLWLVFSYYGLCAKGTVQGHVPHKLLLVSGCNGYPGALQ